MALLANPLSGRQQPFFPATVALVQNLEVHGFLSPNVRHDQRAQHVGSVPWFGVLLFYIFPQQQPDNQSFECLEDPVIIGTSGVTCPVLARFQIPEDIETPKKALMAKNQPWNPKYDSQYRQAGSMKNIKA